MLLNFDHWWTRTRSLVIEFWPESRVSHWEKEWYQETKRIGRSGINNWLTRGIHCFYLERSLYFGHAWGRARQRGTAWWRGKGWRRWWRVGRITNAQRLFQKRRSVRLRIRWRSLEEGYGRRKKAMRIGLTRNTLFEKRQAWTKQIPRWRGKTKWERKRITKVVYVVWIHRITFNQMIRWIRWYQWAAFRASCDASTISSGETISGKAQIYRSCCNKSTFPSSQVFGLLCYISLSLFPTPFHAPHIEIIKSLLQRHRNLFIGSSFAITAYQEEAEEMFAWGNASFSRICASIVFLGEGGKRFGSKIDRLRDGLLPFRVLHQSGSLTKEWGSAHGGFLSQQEADPLNAFHRKKNRRVSLAKWEFTTHDTRHFTVIPVIILTLL